VVVGGVIIVSVMVMSWDVTIFIGMIGVVIVMTVFIIVTTEMMT
jgi:hypothetical protein